MQESGGAPELRHFRSGRTRGGQQDSAQVSPVSTGEERLFTLRQWVAPERL